MDKWDYKHVNSDRAEEMEDQLTELGQAGWELVSVVISHYKYVAFLKRHVEDASGGLP